MGKSNQLSVFPATIDWGDDNVGCVDAVVDDMAVTAEQDD